MLGLDNPEEVLMILDRYRTLKQKNIPKELDEYLNYVAKTGDPVYNWSTIQYLFREKLTNVIREFHDTTPSLDELPPCPNVDAFNYENLKTALLERLDMFHAAPFTVQRLCELLTNPKKHYCRLDKFMRALEKNILVVSTIEPGRKKSESENGDSASLDVSLDSDMERDHSGPASLTKANEESETEAVKVIAGQSTQSNADDSITDDGDVEVKDSLVNLPDMVDDTKSIEVDEEQPKVAVKNTTEQGVEDIHIDVVEENKIEQAVESQVVANEVDTKPIEIETETKSEADEVVLTASTTSEQQLTSEGQVAVADSSVPDVSPAVAAVEEVEPVTETSENVTTSDKVETELNDAISSSVDVTEPKTKETTEEELVDDSECKPSSPKMPRLESNDVDTTNVLEEAIAVGSVSDEAVESVAVSIESEPQVSTDSTQEAISTSSEVGNPLEEETISATLESINPEIVASKPIEADSTEPESKIVNDESIADTPATSSVNPNPEPIIAIESIAEAIVESAEVASSDDIAEVMAVEEDTLSGVDSTASAILTPTDNVAPLVVADTTAMEATPIIPSDEQMDVDETNSADSMDL